MHVFLKQVHLKNTATSKLNLILFTGIEQNLTVLSKLNSGVAQTSSNSYLRTSTITEIQETAN